MTDAMEVLFAHAQDWLVKPLLVAEPEYEELLHAADRQEQRLRALLNSESAQALDAFLDEQRTLYLFYEQALFRTGFRLAMELNC